MYKIVIGVLAATLAVAACGSSSKSNSSGSDTTTTTVSGGGSGSGSGGFSDLVAKAKTAAFKVTYQQNDGKPITIAQDGQGKQSVQSGDSLLISDGTTTISCDGTTSSATCTDVGKLGQGTVEGLTTVFTGVYNGIAALASSPLFNGDTSSQTIAGRDATCVTITSSAIGGVFGAIAGKLGSDASATVCADKDTGVLLKLSGTSGSDTNDVFVATAFSEPTDSDFQPPSTPQTTTSFTIPKISIPNISIPNG